MFNKIANDASECSETFSLAYQAGLELDKKLYEFRVKHPANDNDSQGGVNDDGGGGQMVGRGIGWKKRERKKVDRSWVYQKTSRRIKMRWNVLSCQLYPKLHLYQ